MNIFKLVADNNGVTEDEVRADIQFMIDDLWAHPESETEDFRMLREVLKHKPSPEEMVDYLTSCLRPENTQ